MDENTKEILYKQIVEMYENNLNKTPIMSEQEYMGLSAKEALSYIFSYRDSADFGIDEDDGSRITYYIELPDMDLSGEDLTDVKISEFIPGTFDENSRLWPSYINLENTNASIDLNDIGYTNSRENDRGVTDYIIDFEMMNFNGCSIRGILPDEYSDYEANPKARFKSQYRTQNKEGHLDESYLQRRSKIHLSERAKKVSDKAYQRIINGESLKGMVGIRDNIINLTDYDLEKLNETQMKAFVEAITKYKIGIELRTLSQGPVKEQLDIIHDSDKSLYGEIFFKYIRDAIDLGNMEFAEKYIDDVGFEYKSQLVLFAYEHGDIEFIKRHINSSGISEIVIDQILKKEYEKGNVEFVEENIRKASFQGEEAITLSAYEKGDIEFLKKHHRALDIKREVAFLYENGDYDTIRKIAEDETHHDSWSVAAIANYMYDKGDIDFAKRYFEYLNDENAIKIALGEYDKGNTQFIEDHIEHIRYSEVLGTITLRAYDKGDIDFVEKHLEEIYYSELKTIILKAYDKGDIKFVEKHLEEIHDSELKTIILKAYEKGDIEFVDKHFSYLPLDIRNSIIEEKYKNGDMEFVEKHFSDTPIDIMQRMIFSALDNGDTEYVHTHLKAIQSSKMEKIVKIAHEDGRDDFVKVVLYEYGLSENLTNELISDAYQTGDIVFVEMFFKFLTDGEKKYEIIHDLYQKGNMKFVNSHLSEVPLPYRDNIIMEAMENGDTEFVEKHYKKMSKFQRDTYLRKKAEGEIISAYENGDMEYVDEYFSKISIIMQEKLMRYAFEKGDISFVENHYSDILPSMKNELVQLAYEKGEKDFYERHFKDLSRSTQNSLVLSAYENDDKEFVDKFFNITSDKTKVMSLAIDKGDIDFVERYYDRIISFEKSCLIEMAYDRIASYEKGCLIEMAYEKGHMEFVMKHIDDLSSGAKSRILIRIYQSGNTQYVEDELKKMTDSEKEFFMSRFIISNQDNIEPIRNIITNYVQEEKQCTETIGKREQSRSGKLLYSILCMEEVNPDVVMELVNAGSDVNYTAYSSSTDWDFNKVITYTPILMKALDIEDDEKKKEIVNILLDAGADKFCKKTELTYSNSRYSSNQKKDVHTAMNDESFITILSEREQNKNVHSLLTKEIGLSEEEIANIEATFQEFGNSIYTSSYDKVKRQMEILSAVNCEKAGVAKFPRILFLDPAVIYSRLKFFIDNEIEIDPNALHKTLAATNKKFTMEYGKKILETDKIDESQIGDVKRAMQKKYPMPIRKELLKAELDRIKEKYSEKEMD